MIWLDKKSPVIEPEIEILRRLQIECAKNGLSYFHGGFKAKGHEIQFACPVHKNGQERRASSSITTVEKHRRGPEGGVIEAGTFHCFACGTVMGFTELVSYCLGSIDNGERGSDWIRENFTIGYVNSVDRLAPFPTRESVEDPQEFVTEEELDSYRFYHDYMFKRGLTEEIIERYDVGFDPRFRLTEDSPYTPCVTFPVRDISGRTLFLARRSIAGKLFHYRKDVDKPVYGIYEVYRDNGILENPGKSIDHIVVCESVFNALTSVKWGHPAVALLATGAENQYEVVARLPCDKLYLCLDPDEAGNKGTEKLIRKLQRNNVFVIDLPAGKDVNDVDRQTFEDCMEHATISFMWKKKYF